MSKDAVDVGTPRVDEFIDALMSGDQKGELTLAHFLKITFFARQLERDLTLARSRLQQYDSAFAQVGKALNVGACGGFGDDPLSTARVMCEAVERLRADAGKGGGIYVASRASVPERSTMWRELRDDGAPIISSWIDEAGEGETADFSELWTRILSEISSCQGLVLYAEKTDFPLKGAFVEVGMALALNKPIAIVLDFEPSGDTLRPVGSWIRHPNVRRAANVADAIRALSPPPDNAPSTGGGGG